MNHIYKIYLSITLMGITVYFIRFLGFWLAGYIKFKPTTKQWFEYLPGCVMMAIVAPTILSADLSELFATIAVVTITITTKNIFIAMLLGIAIISMCHMVI